MNSVSVIPIIASRGRQECHIAVWSSFRIVWILGICPSSFVAKRRCIHQQSLCLTWVISCCFIFNIALPNQYILLCHQYILLSCFQTRGSTERGCVSLGGNWLSIQIILNYVCQSTSQFLLSDGISEFEQDGMFCTEFSVLFCVFSFAPCKALWLRLVAAMLPKTMLKGKLEKGILNLLPTATKITNFLCRGKIYLKCCNETFNVNKEVNYWVKVLLPI